MSPFAEHAQNMKDYEGFCSEPISNSGKENSIDIASGNYPAVVGQFIRRDELVNGISPHLVGEVIVQKAALPDNTVFVLGQQVAAYPIGGGCHKCKIYGVDHTFTEWRLQLYDQYQGA